MSHAVDAAPTGSAPMRDWLAEAARDPAGLTDEGYVTLLGADGPDLDALAELADGLRQRAVGDTLTYVVNRNLDPGLVAGRTPQRRDRLAALVVEAHELGATEICLQGALPADSDDDYVDLVAAIHAAAPPLHLHALRPPELLDGAARRGEALPAFLDRLRTAGVGSVPGTAARILDDAVRARMTNGTDLPVTQWIEVIETAHRAGLGSTSTMVYGHVETPGQQVAHLRTLAAIQDRTGGFSEFIAMPYVPGTLPPSFEAIAGPGPSWSQTRAVCAVARLVLHGRVDNIQAAWPKFGLPSSVALLRGGANDLGGLLLDGRLAPEAGAEAGLVLSRHDVERVARQLGRPLRQRTTRYGDV